MRFPDLTDTTWDEVHGRPLAAFRPALDALCARWGLGAREPERLPGGEDCAAFAVSAELVIKVVPPGEAASVAKEVALLGRLADALPVPIPRLHERHDAEGWTALLLSRIPGRLVGAVWPELPEQAREDLLTELGGVARALRSVPIGPTDPRPDLRARAARHGAAAMAWIHRWLPEAGLPVLLHGDLTDENVLVAERDGRWRITGVLDFAGSFVAEAPIELVSPGLFLGRGHSRRIAAFALAAGLDAGPEERLAYHLLHPYSQLPRDLRMCGLPADASLEQAVAAWRG